MGNLIHLIGINSVGARDGIVIGVMIGDRLRPLYNIENQMIKINLLSMYRIPITDEEARTIPFGQRYRHTLLANFSAQPRNI